MPEFSRQKNTNYKNKTLIALLCVSAFSLAACSGHSEQFRPHPPRESTGELSKPDAPTETAPPTTSPESTPSQADNSPTFLYPNGQEVTLTTPGTELAFGEAAIVATTDSEGRYLVWSVTMHDKVDLPVKAVQLLDPNQYAGVQSFACFAYDIEFIGAVSRYTDETMVLTGIPDIVHTAVTPPAFLPGNSQHRGTLRVEGGVDKSCGIPDATRLPTNEGQLVTGFPYARATMSAIQANSAPNEAYTVLHEINGNPDRVFIWK